MHTALTNVATTSSRPRRRQGWRRRIGVAAAGTALAAGMGALSSTAQAAPAFNYSVALSPYSAEGGAVTYTVVMSFSGGTLSAGQTPSVYLTASGGSVSVSAVRGSLVQAGGFGPCEVIRPTVTQCFTSMTRDLSTTYEFVGRVKVTTPGATWTTLTASVTDPDDRDLPGESFDGNGADNRSTASMYVPLGSVRRLAGADRIATALEVARDRDPLVPISNVLISRSDNFPDALAAGPLAAQLGAPLLFTATNALDPRVEEFLKTRVQAGGRVTLLGSTGVLSSAVETRIRGLGFQVSRLAGATRFDTAVAIHNQLESKRTRTRVFLADGRTFQDAVCAGAAASSIKTVGGVPTLSESLLLTDGTTIPPAVVTALNGSSAQVVVMGDIDTSGLDSRVVIRRVTGANAVERCASPNFAPYAAQQAIAPDGRPTGPLGVAFVSADTFPDGLSAAPHASARNLRVFLVSNSRLDLGTLSAVNAISPATDPGRPFNNVVYGGPAVMSDGLLRDLAMGSL